MPTKICLRKRGEDKENDKEKKKTEKMKDDRGQLIFSCTERFWSGLESQEDVLKIFVSHFFTCKKNTLLQLRFEKNGVRTKRHINGSVVLVNTYPSYKNDYFGVNFFVGNRMFSKNPCVFLKLRNSTDFTLVKSWNKIDLRKSFSRKM